MTSTHIRTKRLLVTPIGAAVVGMGVAAVAVALADTQTDDNASVSGAATTTVSITSGPSGAGAGEAIVLVSKTKSGEGSDEHEPSAGQPPPGDTPQFRFHRKAGGDQDRRRIDWSGSSGDDQPTESVSFDFGELHEFYNNHNNQHAR